MPFQDAIDMQTQVGERNAVFVLLVVRVLAFVGILVEFSCTKSRNFCCGKVLWIVGIWVEFECSRDIGNF